MKGQQTLEMAGLKLKEVEEKLEQKGIRVQQELKLKKRKKNMVSNIKITAFRMRQVDLSGSSLQDESNKPISE